MHRLSLLLQMGFFADAGPLQIFVSQHLIPSHYRVEITDDAAFESEENAPPIKAGASIRVRLMGLKAEANQLVSHQHCLQPRQEGHAFGCNIMCVCFQYLLMHTVLLFECKAWSTCLVLCSGGNCVG